MNNNKTTISYKTISRQITSLGFKVRKIEHMGEHINGIIFYDKETKLEYVAVVEKPDLTVFVLNMLVPVVLTNDADINAIKLLCFDVCSDFPGLKIYFTTDEDNLLVHLSFFCEILLLNNADFSKYIIPGVDILNEAIVDFFEKLKQNSLDHMIYDLSEKTAEEIIKTPQKTQRKTDITLN